MPAPNLGLGSLAYTAPARSGTGLPQPRTIPGESPLSSQAAAIVQTHVARQRDIDALVAQVAAARRSTHLNWEGIVAELASLAAPVLTALDAAHAVVTTGQQHLTQLRNTIVPPSPADAVEVALDQEIRSSFRALDDGGRTHALQQWVADGYRAGLVAVVRDPLQLGDLLPGVMRGAEMETRMLAVIDAGKFTQVEQLTRYLDALTAFLAEAPRYITNLCSMSPSAYTQLVEDEGMRQRLIASTSDASA